MPVNNGGGTTVKKKTRAGLPNFSRRAEHAAKSGLHSVETKFDIQKAGRIIVRILNYTNKFSVCFAIHQVH